MKYAYLDWLTSIKDPILEVVNEMCSSPMTISSSYKAQRRAIMIRSITNPSLSLRRHAHGPLAKRLMHMAHLSGNTSGVSKSSSDWLNYTGFPGDVCVAFFNVPPGNKDAVTPNPLMKEESCRVYKCDDARLSGSTKRWIFKSM